MNALAKLHREVETAAAMQLVPSLEALERWRGLVRELVDASKKDWEREPAFRLRTGASSRWCAAHHQEYVARSLARTGADGQREWHVSARPTRAAPGNEEALEDFIVASYGRKAG